MEPRQFFPLGKAYGEAFCNRQQETEQLVGNIKSGKHTLIIAPRRYGKSSLAERAIEKMGILFVKANFHLCTSEEEVAQLIIECVTDLISQLSGKIEKLMISIKKYIFHLEPILSFGNEKASLKLIHSVQKNESVVIMEALLLLENLLKEKNKKAVFFLDEFQEINKISNSKVIEGAFRTAAQEMQHVACIFSGSVRSLLLSMFEDENRPLYKLCRKIRLSRIETHHYETHIQKIAIMTWGKKLSQEAFKKIMMLSHRHPYYINYLCDSIWEICKKLPTVQDVAIAWNRVVVEEWSDALKEISDLSLGQRRLLKYVANREVVNIHSKESCADLSMAASSIAAAAAALMEKDYIEQEDNGFYRVINPLLLSVLQGARD